MSAIRVVSFPRSGQHILQAVLKYVFENHDLNYSFCEFYGCCRSVPCAKSKIIQKNHDFMSSYNILPEAKYVILYRDDMILQLESWYRFVTKMSKADYKEQDLIDFIKLHTEYYNNFKNKWVNSTNTNILAIEYYNFVKNPVICINQIMAHIRPSTILNQSISKIPELEFKEYGKILDESGSITDKIKIQHIMPEELYNKIKLELQKN
jgi:hypothetical protein